MAGKDFLFHEYGGRWEVGGGKKKVMHSHCRYDTCIKFMFFIRRGRKIVNNDGHNHFFFHELINTLQWFHKVQGTISWFYLLFHSISCSSPLLFLWIYILPWKSEELLGDLRKRIADRIGYRSDRVLLIYKGRHLYQNDKNLVNMGVILDDSRRLQLEARYSIRPQNDCSICLTTMSWNPLASSGNREVMRLHCSHAFHKECLRKAKTFTCPQCKQDIYKWL